MPKIDQLPAELHVAISQGDFWEIDVDFSLDLTDYDIAASIHPHGGGDDVVLAITETDLLAGQFSISLAAAQSAALADAYHSWCLILTPPHDPEEDPQPRKFLAGRFIVAACS